MFGPFLLMDKSTFEGLNIECVTYVMKYYRHRISPILLREIHSDLAKEQNGKDATEFKQRVVRLAEKTLMSQSSVLPDALAMVCYELLHEQFIPMNGYQAPRGEAIEVNVPGMGRGIFFDEHPMIATLRNWADGNFSEQDLYRAKMLRAENSNVNLVSLYQEIEQETEEKAKVPAFKSLKEVVDYADEVRFFNKTLRQEMLRIARYFFQDHTGHIGTVMRRWRRKGRPTLRYFAPYAWYVHRVDIVYHYCLLRGFIKCSKKGKAHLDMQYLYYLPFCQIFSSDDKEIMQLVPFFQRPNQIFITKADFQRDLKNLSTYFAGLSEEERTSFYKEHDPFPPDLENSFTVNMWEKFVRSRQKQAGKRSQPSPEKEVEIRKQLKKIREAVEKQQAQNKQRVEGRNGQGTNSTIYL